VGDDAVSTTKTLSQLGRALPPPRNLRGGANAVTASSGAMTRKQTRIFTMPKRPRASRHEQNSESSRVCSLVFSAKKPVKF
jgi:hypothetical protein